MATSTALIVPGLSTKPILMSRTLNSRRVLLVLHSYKVNSSLQISLMQELVEDKWAAEEDELANFNLDSEEKVLIRASELVKLHEEPL